MRADDALIELALGILERWDTQVSASSKPLRDEWVRILRERDGPWLFQPVSAAISCGKPRQLHVRYLPSGDWRLAIGDYSSYIKADTSERLRRLGAGPKTQGIRSACPGRRIRLKCCHQFNGQRGKMQELIDRETYGPQLALKIETMGSISVGVANRWLLGWRNRVVVLLEMGAYLDCLTALVEQEKDVLAEAGDLRHLSPREILQMHGVNEAPPA
jgi:hypothetical protein